MVAARDFIATRGYQSTADDIRRSRHEVFAAAPEIARCYDFFSTSECRDLIFHVQEQRFTITMLAAFIREQNLKFLGFELPQNVFEAYSRRFPADLALTNLDHWHTFEEANPETFAGMYKFWVQKN